MKSAGIFKLNLLDFIKGFVVAILGAVVGLVQTSISAGDFHLDWKAMGTAALISGIAYLTKNFFTNNKDQILAKDIPQS